MLFAAEAPDGPRGHNLELSWATELVAWPRSKALAAWDDLQLATRRGVEKMVWDTTSRGRQPVILNRFAEHRADPALYQIRTGTTFDNPLLSDAFRAMILATCAPGSRRYAEEIMGQVFEEAGGALWQQGWIDDNRVSVEPSPLDIVVFALDPARSAREDADEFGLVCAGRSGSGIYVLADHSGHLTNRFVAETIVDRCMRDASGFVWETNNVGLAVVELISEIARQRGLVLHQLVDDRPFPRRSPGKIYVRQIRADRTKEARADAPARLYADGRVHHVGDLPELEQELLTWEPDGRSKSPNRLDALVYAVAELGGVATYGSPRAAPRVEGAQAQAAQAELRAGMLKIGKGRTI